MTTHHLDEALERLHRSGPEFGGWLSNHGPMAADALLRLGHGDLVTRWVTAYERRLEEAPAPRWPIDPGQWRDPLGDPSRLGDWCALLLREVHEQPWRQVLERWWPRLLPGALASACHGLIRTGHAVRALNDEVTGPRLDELALALAYWAGRWQPLPGGGSAVAARTPVGGAAAPLRTEPTSIEAVLGALDHVPRVAEDGGIRARVAALPAQPGWRASRLAVPAPADPADVPAALDVVVDAAVTRYRDWAHADPVMLVHAATAPRAAGLVLTSLPVEMWQPTFDMAWAVTAAIGSAYRPVERSAPRTPVPRTMAEALDACVRTGDEHAIKFAEVANESAARGITASIASATVAATSLGGRPARGANGEADG